MSNQEFKYKTDEKEGIAKKVNKVTIFQSEKYPVQVLKLLSTRFLGQAW